MAKIVNIESCEYNKVRSRINGSNQVILVLTSPLYSSLLLLSPGRKSLAAKYYKLHQSPLYTRTLQSCLDDDRTYRRTVLLRRHHINMDKFVLKSPVEHKTLTESLPSYLLRKAKEQHDAGKTLWMVILIKYNYHLHF